MTNEKENYECHVTLSPEFASVAATIGRKHKFTSSQIAGDPVLGPAKNFYLTSHDSTLTGMKDRMERLITELKVQGCRITRKKIELIVLDERFVYPT